VQEAWDERSQVLPLEGDVRRHGRWRSPTASVDGRSEPPLKTLAADLTFGREALQAVIPKNGWGLAVLEKMWHGFLAIRA